MRWWGPGSGGGVGVTVAPPGGPRHDPSPAPRACLPRPCHSRSHIARPRLPSPRLRADGRRTAVGVRLLAPRAAREREVRRITRVPHRHGVPSASATPSLTAAQARDALLGPAELGERWSPTQGGATWRDGLLKGRTDVADCQRLLDGLYAEDLLGKPKGAGAVVGLDESDTEAQLRYQVAAYGGPAEVDAKMAWLRTLPEKCAEFTATDVRGERQTVRVVPAALPGVGDAREGLRMTMSGEGDLYGETPTLTLDFAAVRVGDRAVSLTNGGLGGAEEDFTNQAVQLGTQRLQNVLAGGTPRTSPPTNPKTSKPACPPMSQTLNKADTQGSSQTVHSMRSTASLASWRPAPVAAR